jgi:hypothetical protein
VFRTYFINSRGDEAMGSTWNYLDMTALGRQEEWEDSPEGYPQTPPYEWWNWHDDYADTQPADEEWLGRIAGSGRHPRSPRHARPQDADGLTAAEATKVLADDGLDARPHRQMHTTRPGG